MSLPHRSRILLTGCRMALALLLTGLVAQAAELQIRIPAQLDLAAFTDLVAGSLEMPLHYDPQQLRGTVKVQVPGAVDGGALWRLYNEVLLSEEHTTVVRGDPPLYRVCTLKEAVAAAEPWSAERIDSLAYPPGFQMRVLPLAHVGPETAVAQLADLVKGTTVELRALSASPSRLLLAAPTPTMRTLLDALRLLDVPDQALSVQSYLPQRAGVAQLQATLTAAWTARNRIGKQDRAADVQVAADGRHLLLIGSQGTLATMRALAEQLDSQLPRQTRIYQLEQEQVGEVATLVEQLLRPTTGGRATETAQVVRDALTNSLIITATGAEHERITQLLERLRSMPSPARRQLRRYAVKHRQADELLGVLADLLGEQDIEAIALTEEVLPEDTESRPNQADPNSARPMRLTVDASSNSILAQGSPRQLAQLELLLAELDQRQPQVELAVTLVAMNTSKAREIGTSLAHAFADGRTEFNLGALFLQGAEGGNDNSEGSGNGGSIPPERLVPRTGSGLVGAVVRPGDYAAVLRAIENLNDGRTMTRSTTVVNNNAEAVINNVRQEPITAINTNNTVATTTFAGTTDAGTVLTLKPSISAADYVNLVYEISQSQFLGSSVTTAAGATIPPPRQEESLASTATVPDGHVIALGGFITDKDNEGRNQVPWLGRIPLLGWLFRSQSSNSSRSFFAVFIKVDILRHQDFDDLRFRSVPLVEAAGMADPDEPVPVPRMIE